MREPWVGEEEVSRRSKGVLGYSEGLWGWGGGGSRSSHGGAHHFHPEVHSQGPSVERQAVGAVHTGLHPTASMGRQGLWGSCPHPGSPAVPLQRYLRCHILGLPV